MSALDRERWRNQKQWKHPINELRIVEGAYQVLYPQLRQHPLKFLNYMRMTTQYFDQLLEMITPLIQRQDTHFQDCIPPAERLMVILRFLATVECFSSLHFKFRLGKTTISHMVIDTCIAIWDALQLKYMPQPTAERWP